MLEAKQQPDNNFVTLTYSDENLPLTTSNLPNLIPRDLQLWLKRFRKATVSSPETRFRYYAVGEYSPSGRPHFHVILFNSPKCHYGQTRTSPKGLPRSGQCCPTCHQIAATWQTRKIGDIWEDTGLIYCGEVNDQSAAYVAGYVEKKLDKDHPDLLGRNPEFSTMSRRPGIGQGMMHDVANELLKYDLHLKYDDVPQSLRHGKRVMPLGPYLTRQLRKLVGKDEKAPQSTLDKVKEEMRPLRESAFNNSRSFKTEVIQAGTQAVTNMEKRSNIFKKRKRL